MLDVIDFMERMGGDAQLSQASVEDLDASLSVTDMAPELRSAILAKDAKRLGQLLGTIPECVLLSPPGPPGSDPSPMQPATPPPPPEETEEDEETKDISRDSGVAASAVNRRESLRA
jgi:hypothetical protein